MSLNKNYGDYETQKFLSNNYKGRGFISFSLCLLSKDFRFTYPCA